MSGGNKARKKRRRDLERWRADRLPWFVKYERGKLTPDISPMIRATIAELSRGITAFWNAVRDFIYAFFDELRKFGGDGASLAGVRFASEGGFALN